MKRLASAAALAALLVATPTRAAFHLMVIQEVFVGAPDDCTKAPNQRAQYVMLRMTSSGQTFVGGTSVRVEDADGNILGNFGTLGAGDSPNGGGGACSYPGCPAILMGTTAADNLFTFSFNRDVEGQPGHVALPLDAGRVCFVSGSSIMDCVAWGNFDCTRSGNCAVPNGLHTGEASAQGCDTNFGTPAAPGGLAYGFALTRGAFNCAAKENSTDFAQTFPHPVNNAGANNNTDSDGDGLIDVLDCDDTSAQFRWPVAEVCVASSPDRKTISWGSPHGPGPTYDVVRGSIAALNGFADAACFTPGITVSTTDTSTPADNAGLYYLVRGKSSAACGGVGTYGPGRSAVDPLCP